MRLTNWRAIQNQDMGAKIRKALKDIPTGPVTAKEVRDLMAIGLKSEEELHPDFPVNGRLSGGVESRHAEENPSWQQESGIGNIGAIEESEITNGSEQKRLSEVAATVTSETQDASTSIMSGGKLNASATSSAKAETGLRLRSRSALSSAPTVIEKNTVRSAPPAQSLSELDPACDGWGNLWEEVGKAFFGK